MYCSKCGNEILDGSLFCNKCGTEVRQENNEVVVDEPVAETVSSVEKPKKKVPVLMIIALIGTLLAFFITPSPITKPGLLLDFGVFIIVYVAILVLAIISIVKKERLFGISIAIAIFTLMYLVDSSVGIYGIATSDEVANDYISNNIARRVDPDLKEMLDEYEEFMDDFVTFAKKYKNASVADALSMYAEYITYLSKATTLAEKAEKVDTSKLSEADLAYYNIVMNRMTEKYKEIE